MTEQEFILVTAGILIEGGRVLICQRHHSDPYGMQWEFPGGKVNAGEELKASLRRELAEELTIQAEIDEEVFRLHHQYPDRAVDVVFFAVRKFRGTITESGVRGDRVGGPFPAESVQLSRGGPRTGAPALT